MARLYLLATKQPRVFQSNSRFARQHPHQFEMPIVESPFLPAENGHDTHGAVVKHQRYRAETTHRHQGFNAQTARLLRHIFPDQKRLAVLDDVLRQVIAAGPRAFWLRCAITDFEFKAKHVAGGIKERDVEVAGIEQPLHLGVNFFKQVVGIERGAEHTSYLVQDVQFLAAARSLLDQVAVLHGHADLVAQRQEKVKLGRSEASAVGCAQQEDTESPLFGLQADGCHRAQTLLKRELPESLE